MNSPFTEKMLDDFRKQGDPLADEVVTTFASQYGASVELLTEKLENMIRMPPNDEMCEIIKDHFATNEAICQALKKYYATATQCPDWLDDDKLNLGRKVFQDHLFSSVIMLACASLPVCYACQPDVKVLSFTRRLIDNVPIRLVETAQMLTDVMGNNGIIIKNGRLTGKGVQSALKIRLIHAAVRYLILNKKTLMDQPRTETTPGFLITYICDDVQEQYAWYGDKKPGVWDVKADGTPVNKEATALALLTFSYIILRGLKTIGIKLNSPQQEAYLHSWNIIGYVMGVEQTFLDQFNHYNSAEAVFSQLIKRRRGSTQDGQLLQRALLDVFESTAWALLPLRRLLHARRLARLMTSLFISKESYKTLGLKLSTYDMIIRFFIWLGLRIFAFAVNFKLLRPFADYMFRHIARTLWDWREDIALDTRLNGDNKTRQKHLLIPHGLIATSYLSGKFKDKPEF